LCSVNQQVYVKVLPSRTNGLAKAFLLTSSKAAYRTQAGCDSKLPCGLQQLFPRLRAPLAGCQIVEK